MEKYMSLTDRTMQYVFSGTISPGPQLTDELMAKYITENKKIWWYIDYTALDKMSWDLVELSEKIEDE